MCVLKPVLRADLKKCGSKLLSNHTTMVGEWWKIIVILTFFKYVRNKDLVLNVRFGFYGIVLVLCCHGTPSKEADLIMHA